MTEHLYTYEPVGQIYRDGKPFVILAAAPGLEKEIYNADLEATAKAFVNQQTTEKTLLQLYDELAGAVLGCHCNGMALVGHEEAVQTARGLRYVFTGHPTAPMLEVLKERLRQDQKWGEQNHDPMVYLSILMEEVGEAAKEANEARFSIDKSHSKQVEHLAKFRVEMIQVCAVALAIIECLDRKKWRWGDTSKSGPR